MEQLHTHAAQRQQLHRATCQIAESYKEAVETRPFCTIAEKSDWISVKEATQMFPFGRTYICDLIKNGEIDSRLIRKRGNVSGKRVLSISSLERFIASHPRPKIKRIEDAINRSIEDEIDREIEEAR